MGMPVPVGGGRDTSLLPPLVEAGGGDLDGGTKVVEGDGVTS